MHFNKFLKDLLKTLLIDKIQPVGISKVGNRKLKILSPPEA